MTYTTLKWQRYQEKGGAQDVLDAIVFTKSVNWYVSM